MFIEACLISFGLHAGSELYKKIRRGINNTADKPEPDSKNELQKIVTDLDTACQTFVQENIDPLFGDTRGRQLKTLSLTGKAPQISEQEKQVNRFLGLGTANAGLAVISRVFYPPLLVLTIPTILVYNISFFKDAFQALFKEHRISISILDSVIGIWILLSGYWFAGSLGLFLFNLYKKILSKTKESSQAKLVDVFGQHPRSVWIMADDTEIEIPFEQLKAGDIVVVNAGEIIPADGVIIKGIASIDQQALTGESQPAEKDAGERVFASTVILSGRICVRVEMAGQETVAAKIGEVLNRTTGHKTSIELKSERIADQATLPTLGLSGLAYTVAGSSGGLAILFSCIGYTMRILSPMSTLNFLRIASENSILIKDGRALEKLAQVDTIVFDKTGTLTVEQPCLNKLYSCNGLSEETLLTYAAAAEFRQNHPVARAILAAADKRKLSLPDIEDACYEAGYGIRVKLSERLIRVGSERFMEMENIPVPQDIKMIQETCGIQGYSLVMLAVDNELGGAIELRPAIRPEAKQVISGLHQQNISTCIISGDHEQPTRTLAHKLEIDSYYADTLPEQKAEIIEQLQKKGKTVCFIGDGLNDSIALKKADVSVSLRGAATAAIDSAQIVLMDDNLASITRLLDISRKFEANQKTNLAISFIPGVICIGGVFLFHFGIYTSFLLYYGSIVAGIGNATRPLIQYRKTSV